MKKDIDKENWKTDMNTEWSIDRSWGISGFTGEVCVETTLDWMVHLQCLKDWKLLDAKGCLVKDPSPINRWYNDQGTLSFIQKCESYTVSGLTLATLATGIPGDEVLGGLLQVFQSALDAVQNIIDTLKSAVQTAKNAFAIADFFQNLKQDAGWKCPDPCSSS